MDFLDTLDLDTKDKKSSRVQIWYLYEQYKALERDQLDDTQELENQVHQHRILRKELFERKARRKLYNKFGISQSESKLQKTFQSNAAHIKLVSVSNDEFFDSFNKHEEDECSTHEIDINDNDSQDSSPSSCLIEDLKSVEEAKENMSYPESVNSVAENCMLSEECEYLDYKKESFTTLAVVQDINKQLDIVKQNIQCLEKITSAQDIDKNTEYDSKYFEEDRYKSDTFTTNDVDLREQYHESNQIEYITENNHWEYNNLIQFWSRLVSFAYRVVRLNHGNCYCDYSSQFLTAVLACDVLRRGVNRMCNILQPYVSPIKFSDDESDVSHCYCKGMKTKKSAQQRKYKKRFENKLYRKNTHYDKFSRQQRNYSENCCCYRRSFYENRNPAKPRWSSEPWRSDVYSKNHCPETCSSSDSSIKADIIVKTTPKAMYKRRSCCKRAIHPMMKITHCVDRILKDIDDSGTEFKIVCNQ